MSNKPQWTPDEWEKIMGRKRGWPNLGQFTIDVLSVFFVLFTVFIVKDIFL